MRRHRHSARVLGAVLAAIAGAGFADTPLLPPEDFEHRYENVVVAGDVAAGTTTVTPIGVGDGAAWVVPVWARSYRMSQDGAAILVLNDDINLLGSRDPAQIVATVFSVRGGRLVAQRIALDDVMDPGAMPATVSHFVWLTQVRTIADGWVFELADGTTAAVMQ